MTHPLFETHRATLDGALAALAKRDYWSPYPEVMSGKIYGETANAEAKTRFEAQLGTPFELDQRGNGTIGNERSPYGFDLGILYPKADVDTLLTAAKAPLSAWRKAGIEARTGICLEILQRL